VPGALSSSPITQIFVPPTSLAVADTSISVSSGVTSRLMTAALRCQSVTLTASASLSVWFALPSRVLTSSAFTVTGSSPSPSFTCPRTTLSATAWMRLLSGSATLSSFAAASAAPSAAFWSTVVCRLQVE
jgi:hypothetical protein